MRRDVSHPVSMTLATQIPASLRAGDTWTWQVSLPDYPAPTWVLSYILYSSTAKTTLTATASGSSHLILVPTTTSDDIAPGRCDWIASVTNGSERYQVASGAVEVLVNIAAIVSGGYDGRSQARQILDALDALMASRATDDQLDLIRTQLGDRAVQRDPVALLKWRQHYAAIVANEDRAMARARGESGFVQMRFT